MNELYKNYLEWRKGIITKKLKVNKFKISRLQDELNQRAEDMPYHLRENPVKALLIGAYDIYQRMIPLTSEQLSLEEKESQLLNKLGVQNAN